MFEEQAMLRCNQKILMGHAISNSILKHADRVSGQIIGLVWSQCAFLSPDPGQRANDLPILAPVISHYTVANSQVFDSDFSARSADHRSGEEADQGNGITGKCESVFRGRIGPCQLNGSRTTISRVSTQLARGGHSSTDDCAAEIIEIDRAAI
ncbi:hypothetical protein A0J51_03292 [Gluconobacter japonicus]|nr:hypothetical protein A0J51_03292 [Gluconobacter japonicus]